MPPTCGRRRGHKDGTCRDLRFAHEIGAVGFGPAAPFFRISDDDPVGSADLLVELPVTQDRFRQRAPALGPAFLEKLHVQDRIGDVHDALEGLGYGADEIREVLHDLPAETDRSLLLRLALQRLAVAS